MGNNIFSLRLNVAALAAAHSFLSSHEQYGIQTQRVWVERVPDTAVRLHALDGHHYICFLLREGNPSGVPFQTFGFRLTPAELRGVFNGPECCTESVYVDDLDGSSPTLRTPGAVMALELSPASDAPDFRKFWMRLDDAGDPPLSDTSVLPLRAAELFDLRKYFSGAYEAPAFVRRGREMTGVIISGLPYGIDARGIAMQMNAAGSQEVFDEHFGLLVPFWLLEDRYVV